MIASINYVNTAKTHKIKITKSFQNNFQYWELKIEVWNGENANDRKIYKKENKLKSETLTYFSILDSLKKKFC